MVLNLSRDTELLSMGYGEMDLDLASVLHETQYLSPGIETSIDVIATMEEIMELQDIALESSNVTVSVPYNRL